MEAYFSKDKMFQWIKEFSEEMNEEGFKNIETWMNLLDGQNITKYKEDASKYETTLNIDYLFMVSLYNDYAEIYDIIAIHPEWVNWENI